MHACMRHTSLLSCPTSVFPLLKRETYNNGWLAACVYSKQNMCVHCVRACVVP